MKTPVLGFAMCGSFCTFAPVLAALEELHTVFPAIIPIPGSRGSQGFGMEQIQQNIYKAVGMDLQ